MIANQDVGHNNPPSQIEYVKDVADALNEFLKEHPAISSEDEAREAKPFIDRAKLYLKDLEDERWSKVAPLNTKLAEINGSYRGPREFLERILNELQWRISVFLRQEEQKRKEAALLARQQAEEAEAKAREAERLEKEQIENARGGELGVDIAAATAEADQSFKAYEKAERQAALSEKNASVRIGGGFGRSLGLRKKESLVVTDVAAVMAAVGLTPAIQAAILTAARSYRQLHNKLPPGIEAQVERGI